MNEATNDATTTNSAPGKPDVMGMIAAAEALRAEPNFTPPPQARAWGELSNMETLVSDLKDAAMALNRCAMGMESEGDTSAVLFIERAISKLADEIDERRQAAAAALRECDPTDIGMAARLVAMSRCRAAPSDRGEEGGE